MSIFSSVYSAHKTYDKFYNKKTTIRQVFFFESCVIRFMSYLSLIGVSDLFIHSKKKQQSTAGFPI